MYSGYANELGIGVRNIEADDIVLLVDLHIGHGSHSSISGLLVLHLKAAGGETRVG
jgi:hypothetical protein